MRPSAIFQRALVGASAIAVCAFFGAVLRARNWQAVSAVGERHVWRLVVPADPGRLGIHALPPERIAAMLTADE